MYALLFALNIFILILCKIFIDIYIESRYNHYIEVRYIEIKCIRGHMDSKLKRIYVPMTETGFYILFCLQKPQHGYGIGLQVKKMTDGEVSISAGTMYGTLSKMEKDGLIAFFAEKEKRKLYQITPLGREILDLEIQRIKRLYRNSMEEI